MPSKGPSGPNRDTDFLQDRSLQVGKAQSGGIKTQSDC